MKLSTKTRYGLRAMIEIGQNFTETGVLQKDISENQEISNKYLDHIIKGLKVAGLITKAKGRKSGYILARKAKEITLYDIHRAFEPELCLIDCLSKVTPCNRKKHCLARKYWSELNSIIIEYFKSVSLDKMINSGEKI